MMSSQKGAFYMIAISIVLAGVMIYLGNFVDLEMSQTAIYLLISLWFVTFSLIQQRTKKSNPTKYKKVIKINNA